MAMLYLHNDIFLTDIIGYDRLNSVKFIPQMKFWVRHCELRTENWAIANRSRLCGINPLDGRADKPYVIFC